ncbi:MAG: hypothetical protein AAF907_04670 [Planctomycetota bacterium]
MRFAPLSGLTAAAVAVSLGSASVPSAEAGQPVVYQTTTGVPTTGRVIYRSATPYQSAVPSQYQSVAQPVIRYQPVYRMQGVPGRTYVMQPTRPYQYRYAAPTRTLPRSNYLGGGPAAAFNRGRSRSPAYGFHRRPIGAFNTGNYRRR